MARDFTYIDDLVEAIVRLNGRPPRQRALTGYLPDTPLEVGMQAFPDWFKRWRAAQG